MKIENKIAKIEEEKRRVEDSINSMNKINIVLERLIFIIIGMVIGYIIWGIA